MWCGACQQDVPGVAASASDLTVCCARCGKALSRSAAGAAAGAAAAAAAGVPFEDLPEFIELEDWEFAETIQQAERIVRNATSDLRVPNQKSPEQKIERWDRPHAQKRVTRHLPPSDNLVSEAPTKNPHSVPWLVLAMGLGVFVCGAALVVLSLVNQRPQLWQLGLPMLLGGQVAILAVVIWQFEAIWNSNRAAFVALHAMDDQVRQMRDEWTQLQQQDEAEDQPFYRHIAEGASPDVLLADLKDQLDILSQHLAQDKRAA